MIKDLEFKIKKLPNEMPFQLEEAVDSFGIKYVRKKGSSIIYEVVDDIYVCDSCRAVVKPTILIYLIEHKKTSLPEEDEMYNFDEIIYCPNCEEKPAY